MKNQVAYSRNAKRSHHYEHSDPLKSIDIINHLMQLVYKVI